MSLEEEAPSPLADNGKLLPILIIPGLMSSGLEIKESKINRGWEGKRIWLNLSSVGISAMYFGKAQKTIEDPSQDLDDEEEKDQQAKCKSSWLTHMLLNGDKESDAPGIKVRAVPGLEGVDYMAPGAFTSTLSYVFGPVIKILEERGYNSVDGKINLMAAPYDWRLAPSTMESRDKYFSKTMDYVEELYNNNDSTPVVLLCHSLGSKVAHYLLNFALDTRGQDWIDKYVHTYMPVGGAHLGAPKAMRALISGQYPLQQFLSPEERLIMSRSLGSGPWLIPSDLPEDVAGTNYILPHGVLEISITHAVDVDPLVNKRSSLNRPKKYQLQISGKGFDGPEGGDTERTIRTLFQPISDDHGTDVVVFNDKFSFATDMKPYYNETLQFLLQEPGLASAKKEKSQCQCNPLVYLLCCLCIPCMLAYKVFEVVLCGLIRGATLTADAIAGSAGGSTTLAFSEGVKIPKSVFNGKAVTIKVPLYHTDDYGQYEGCLTARKRSRQTNLYVELKWTTFDNSKSFRRICSPLCRPSASAVKLPITNKNIPHELFTGYDIAIREGLEEYLRFIKNKYDNDKYRPRNYSSVDPPPVNRIHAIYGVNLPTEIGCAYTRQDTCISDGKLQSFYVPDKNAMICENSGYTISDGLIMETAETKQKAWGDIQVSGDGTVPYWSLAHSKTWNSEERLVTVQELDGAQHRRILGDPRFHQALLNYVCVTE